MAWCQLRRLATIIWSSVSAAGADDRPRESGVCADITYIPVQGGFLYLVAIMDWASRRVLAWRLSNTLDTRFCVEALEEALEMYGTPEIFNTDQGSQFTSIAFTELLEAAGVRCSMDGRGRCLDNVFIERLWRSLKYEAVYLHEFRGAAGDRRVDRVLQRGTTALGTRWPDAVRGLPRRRGARTGGGVTDMGSRWQLRVPRSEGERVCDPGAGSYPQCPQDQAPPPPDPHPLLPPPVLEREG